MSMEEIFEFFLYKPFYIVLFWQVFVYWLKSSKIDRNDILKQTISTNNILLTSVSLNKALWLMSICNLINSITVQNKSIQQRTKDRLLYLMYICMFLRPNICGEQCLVHADVITIFLHYHMCCVYHTIRFKWIFSDNKNL